ncbi:sensor histidine kinase [Bacillus marasmi]|uniref:sensor histidine kinase n=1 Tax=Bacillus marasmi TaxID=1926279 RepID=UPI0011C734EC|nr:sensor histidine kinase [Bacillus marasmi]
MDEDALKIARQKMSARIIEVQEEERKRISRNLHDDLGQNLYSHLISINLLQSQVEHPLIEQIKLEATQLIEQVREISWELRPALLDDLGLIPAIRSFITKFNENYQLVIHFDYTLNHVLENHIELAIYRIIQEALTNIRKYAHVKEAWLSVTELPSSVQVIIVDHGKGFNPQEQTKGVGMLSMEERVRAVGGIFQYQTLIGKGTKIIVDIPL